MERAIAPSVTRTLKADTAPIQLQDPNGTYYVHSDRLRTPRWITNSAATVVWRARYEAYGRATVENDPDGNGNAVVFNIRLPGNTRTRRLVCTITSCATTRSLFVGRYASADPLRSAPDRTLVHARG